MNCPVCNVKLETVKVPSRLKEAVAGALVGVFAMGLYFYFYGFFIAAYQAETALKAQLQCEDKLVKYAEATAASTAYDMRHPVWEKAEGK
jgi:hypothetical protein